MAIVGLTHEKDGRVRLSRTITTKVAIGLPPSDGKNYPTRLDHFVFLKKGVRGQGKGAEVVWEPDTNKMEHYGASCREFWIVLLDDDPDQVFRTEYAAFVKTQKWCWGDGEQATRKTREVPEGKPWTPCANATCPQLESGECKPSGDLYFMLADFPALGTICRLHTSSYQSIREIRSALEDLRGVTGGRLLGLRCKLSVRAERNVYVGTDQKRVTGTKWVLALELAAADLPQLASSMVETQRLFAGVRAQLNGRVLDINEDPNDRADEIAAEFYDVPVDALAPAPEPKVVTEEEEAQRQTLLDLYARSKALMEELKLTKAQQMDLMGKFDKRPAELIAELEKRKAKPKGPIIDAPQHKQATKVRETVERAKQSPKEELTPLERELGFTDADQQAIENTKVNTAVSTTVSTTSKPAAKGWDF